MLTNKCLFSYKTNTSSITRQSFPKSDSRNTEDPVIIWFDSSADVDQTKSLLQEWNIYAYFHTDLEPCLNFIETIDKETIIMIISGDDSIEFLPYTMKFCQIHAIYIIVNVKDSFKYNYLLENYPIIYGIYTDFDSLCKCIRAEMNSVNDALLRFNILVNPHQISSEYVSKELVEFLWFQLFRHVLLRLPHYQQTKNEMIQVCEAYFTNDSKQKKSIEEFQRDYESEKAIYWYLKQSFISKLMFQALKTQDINRLCMIRFFIQDLQENMLCEHQKIVSSDEQIITVYRGAKLTQHDVNKLKHNEDVLLFMYNYLCAYRNRSSALHVAKTLTRRSDLISVLFEIEINTKRLKRNVVFADITQYSEHPDRQEILFDINTTFNVTNIQYHESILLVKMYASDESQTIVKKYLREKNIKTEEKNMYIVFGRLMCGLGQYDQAQHYFEQLSTKTHEEYLAWIEFNLGRVLDFKLEWNLAHDYYYRAYARMMIGEPPHWKEASYMLNKFAIILHQQGKNDKALYYYLQALKTYEGFNAIDTADYTVILSNIACVLNTQGKYKEANEYHRRVLAILERVQTSDPMEIAKNLNNMGNVLYQEGNFKMAIDHYQKALEIQENLNLHGHHHIIQTMSNVALTLNVQGKYDEALEFCQRALNMQQILRPTDHIDTAGILNNIGVILYNLGNYDDALYYHQQALIIRKNYYAYDHVDIAESLNNIGNVLYQFGEYDQALTYYLEVLEIRERSCSSCHIEIAICLNNIGCALNQQKKYDEAIHYHRNALKIQQQLYSSGHSDMIYSLTNIGNILCQKGQYQEALVCHEQALKIRQRFYPSDHISMGDSFNNIGMIYKYMKKSSLSRRYLQHALTIYQKLLPAGHPHLVIVQTNIRNLFF